MGFNRHTSRAIVFGPPLLGGIGLVHRYAQQGSEGITHFLSHVRDVSDVGKMVLNTLSHLQFFSGQLIGLLENPQPLPVVRLRKEKNLYRWSHLGRGWLLSLRQFLFDINGRVILHQAWSPSLVRDNDIELMDAFRQRCSPSEAYLALQTQFDYICGSLRRHNGCRRWFH